MIVALLAAVAAAQPPLSPQATALIAPVRAAYAKIDAEQARLPPPASDRERLERLMDEDQAGRNALESIDFTSLPEDQRNAARTAMWVEISAHDRADQAALKRMIPAEGWFLKSKYGDKAANAAFLIVQHAVNDPPLMRATLARLEPLVRQGEAEGEAYALLYDRVALEFDHKPQRYGSQVWCSGGAWKVRDLEDPARVDERRKAVGLRQTEAEYLSYFSKMPCS